MFITHQSQELRKQLEVLYTKIYLLQFYSSLGDRSCVSIDTPCVHTSAHSHSPHCSEAEAASFCLLVGKETSELILHVILNSVGII